MTLIPGVELSCGAQKEIHVLGYGFDPADEALQAFCYERVRQREARTAAMVERLCALGKPVEMADLLAGRVNKDTCDVLSDRIKAAFAELSGGRSLLAPQTAKKA